MSATKGLRNDLNQVIDEWKQLPATIRLLDFISIISIGIFGIAVFGLLILDVPIIVTNVIFMMYPVFIASFTYTFRSKLNDPEADNNQARREFLLLVIIVTTFVPISLVYSAFLESA